MSTTSADKKFVFGDFGHCAAFGFGAGLFPRAPGTCGTLLAFPLYFLGEWAGLPFWGEWCVFLALFFGGAVLCGRAARALNTPDDGGIVLDEIAAFYGVLICIPAGLFWGGAAFAVFRLLDSLKPPPINWLDKNIGGGWGVMLDDAAAGILTVAAVYGAGYFIS